MKEKLNKEQYLLIVGCAVKEDFSTWNEYVRETEDLIKLRGANFEGLVIKDAIFQNKSGKGADFYGANFSNAHLSSVDMIDCNFMEANLSSLCAEGSAFHSANFVRAELTTSTFTLCNFYDASFQEANMLSVEFYESHFQDCNFNRADLSKAKFYGGGYNPLVRQELRFNLCGANFYNAKFTSDTYFHLADVSKETDFRTISFESACYSAGLKQSLQYCNRRHNWNDWYDNNGAVVKRFVRLFWFASNYGSSPKRVIQSFFSVCFLYALIYWVFPSLTSVDGDLSFIRSVYFSVVTMTTLGFGDIYANACSWFSQLLLITHVLSGYVLLGALITVLSNLFTADGPSRGLVKHPPEPKTRIRISVKNVT